LVLDHAKEEGNGARVGGQRHVVGPALANVGPGSR
jgi:hypothetical protein